MTKVEARVKKDKAEDAANIKAKKNGPLPLHLPSLPHQPKGKARNNSTPHSSLSHCPFHGPACHCGRSRLTGISPLLPLQHPSFFHFPTHMARLAIVAGPALQPTSPTNFPPLILIPIHPSSPSLRPGLSLWQVPPHSSHFFLSITPPPFFYILTHMAWPVIVAGLAFQPASPPSSSYLLPHHPHHSGPACHCGRSRQDPSSLSLHLHPSGFPSLTFVICLARLTIVASPASSIFTTYPSPPPFTPFCSSPLEARLVIVAGPAWSSPSTSRPCLFSLLLSPLPLLSLSSCRPARAGRHGRSKVILLPLCHLRSTSDLTGFPALREVPVAPDCLAVPHLPVPCHYDGLRRLAVPRFCVLCGRYGSLLRPCRVLPAVQDHLSGF